MDRELYWLWLSNIPGIGRKKTEALLSCFETPEALFHANSLMLSEVVSSFTCFRKKDLDVLLESRNIERLEAYSKKLMAAQIKYLSIEHPDYPKALKNIYDPPYLLYYKGELVEEETIKISIVGARKCSAYGKNVAEYFAKKLAKNNVVVISGMARGIDTAAHKGALDGGGKTLAILGSGVNICYPSENVHLMKSIIQNGAVISEYPVNAAPIPGNFPLRNRIISGLCDGLLIVEASDKSGSLITADAALEQGKDVFTVPGKIFDPLSEGTNRLLKMGAKPVTDVEDILEEYIEMKGRAQTDLKEHACISLLDEEEKLVYNCLSLEPIQLDEIILKVPMPIETINFVLIKLEIKGIVAQLPNKYFVKKV